MLEPRMQRHDLVWISPEAVQYAQAAGPMPMEPTRALSLLHRWAHCKYPLIVARQDNLPATHPGDRWLRVGLAEPPSWGKRRMGYLVRRVDVLLHRRGPALGDVLHCLPLPWQKPASALVQALAHLRVQAHVFGSAAIQCTTDLTCLHAGSDLDLLFVPPSWPAAQALCLLLEDLRKAHPACPMDGEVLNPDGQAVHWRELLSRPDQLLCKSLQGVRLLDVEEYCEGFEYAPEARA
ncbi:malonate decarboxylase holo-[acyl-carrier-protein] synthase [Limnobacter sp.]|uniref:malonate decarboxylase holo-[acyl-carrier-protein] synthase n=1 Tax=Limnobacter sp. TaxID=2003368 RepID=UPI0035138AAA